MANWLQKVSRSAAKLKTGNLPVLRQWQPLAPPRSSSGGQPAQLPPASIIYGIAARALFVMGLYFLFTGRWFTGFLVILPAVALLGFAMHFLKR